MTLMNMHEAKTHLSQLVERALKGEEIVIARAGKPLVRLQVVQPEEPVKKPRQLGTLRGKLSLPDDFFEPLSEEETALWYADNIFPDNEQ